MGLTPSIYLDLSSSIGYRYILKDNMISRVNPNPCRVCVCDLFLFDIRARVLFVKALDYIW